MAEFPPTSSGVSRPGVHQLLTWDKPPGLRLHRPPEESRHGTHCRERTRPVLDTDSTRDNDNGGGG